MATVLDRFNKLGLASSKPLLSKAGELVRERWRVYANTYQTHEDLSESFQVENGEQILVNNYPKYFEYFMDEVIMSFVNGGTNG